MALIEAVSSSIVAKKGAGSVMSVGRALEIMRILAGNRHGLRLAEIATALKADRANVLRILGEMERHGVVHEDPVSSRYRLTFLVTALGFRHLDAAGIGDWVNPILEQLADTTQELVRMTVSDGGVLRWIAKAQGANSALILDPEMGGEVVLHVTATGKAWLAEHPDQDAIRLALRQGFRPQTPATIRTVEAFTAELASIRERGYAVTLGEGEVSTFAVAAAIRARVPAAPARGEGEALSGQDGLQRLVAVGTVSVAGPVPRVTPERLHEWAPEVVRAAALIGETWGPYVVDLLRDGNGSSSAGAARGMGRSSRNGRR